MNEQLRAQFEAWHEQDEHQKIVDAVLALPPEERGYEETGQLARAYNNLGAVRISAGTTGLAIPTSICTRTSGPQPHSTARSHSIRRTPTAGFLSRW